jgi:hypothetical protein
MPPRRWTKQRILGELVSQCGLPASGTIESLGHQLAALVYIDSGLCRQLLVYPDRRPGLLRWHVHVYDPQLRPAGTAWFTTHYSPTRPRRWLPDEPVVDHDWPYRRFDDGYDWPSGNGPLDPLLVEHVRRFAIGMLWFLKDRGELGRLLLAGSGDERGSWERDGVTASPYAGAPAGVVQAVILARMVGDRELDALALDKLHREREQPVDGFGGTFAQAVGYWASEKADHYPVDISDLVELDKRRPRDHEVRRHLHGRLPGRPTACSADSG